jgi:hypothetical protein
MFENGYTVAAALPAVTGWLDLLLYLKVVAHGTRYCR